MDPDTVRLEFFRRVRFGKLYEASKIRRPNLPFTSRLPVPGAIKKIYNKRADDFPIENSTCVVETPPPGYMATDQMDWLNAIALMKERCLDQFQWSQTLSILFFVVSPLLNNFLLYLAPPRKIRKNQSLKGTNKRLKDFGKRTANETMM